MDSPEQQGEELTPTPEDSSISDDSKDSSTVFWFSIFFCSVIACWGVIAPKHMTGTAFAVTRFVLNNLSWFFLSICTFFLGLSVCIAFSRYGNLKLGGPDEKPEFSTLSWLSMLFAAGMGAGLLFWGVAEPIYHYMSPPGMQGKTPQAASNAFVITNFHWGFHAWGAYAISALVLAYFGFRKNQPYLPSKPVEFAFSGKHMGKLCMVINVTAILSVIFGVAGSLSMGVMQIQAGLNAATGGLSGSPFLISLGIMLLVTICYMISASTSLDKGIQILSNINMATAVLLLLFVIFFGPTKFILAIFVNSLGDYINSLFTMSFRLYAYDPELQNWLSGWTLTYFIWWIAWGPFVGIFIARISRGRTIRQFVIGVICLPTLFSILWFSAFGGAGLHIEMATNSFGQLVHEDVTTALFVFFDYYPFTILLQIVALFLIFIFLVTSADSATYVIGMMSSEGSLDPPTKRKLLWGVVIALLSGATLISRNTEIPKAIAISGAIPFSIVLLIQIVAFIKVLRTEDAGEKLS